MTQLFLCRQVVRSRKGTVQFYLAYELIQRIREGDIGAIISVSIPIAFVFWMIVRYQILPAWKWRAPSGPVERTYFYRKKEVTGEEESLSSSGQRGGRAEEGAGGPPEADP